MSMCGPPTGGCRSSPTARWSRPTPAPRVGGRITDYADYPLEKIAFPMRSPTWCRDTAAGIGPGTATLIGELLAVNALHRLRAAQGVLGLAGPHGPKRLEAACAKRSRSATRATARSRASCSLAPRPTRPPEPRRSTHRRTCAARRR
jgi:hypothetical protein